MVGSLFSTFDAVLADTALVFVDYIIVLTILSGLLSVLLVRYRTRRDVQFVVVGAFVLRVAYGTIDDHLQILAGRYDFRQFDAVLWSVAQHWQQGNLFVLLELPDPFYLLYSIIYGPVYTVFGHDTVLIRLVTALLGALFVWNVYRITAHLNTHEAGLFASGLAATYPYWIYLSGLFYRDMLVMFLLSQMVYLLLRSVRGDSTLPLGGATIFALLAISLRIHNIVIIVATFGVVAAIIIYNNAGRNALVTALVSVVGLSGVFVWSLQSIKILKLASARPIATLRRTREFLAREAATGAYLSDVLYTNVFELIIFLPIGSAYFWLVPFPWQVSTMLGGAALVQNLLMWYPVVLLGLLGFWYLARTRSTEALVLGVFVITGTLLYGAVEGNVGPALRHRSQFQFCTFIFAGIAVSRLFTFELGESHRIIPRRSESAQNVSPSDD